MRKVLGAALLFAAVGSTPVVAQSGFGLVGGLVSSKLAEEFDGETSDGSSRLTSFAVGLSMQRAAGPNLTFAPELLYIVKGVRFVDEDDFQAKFSYVEVPLLFRYSFSGGGQVTPFITAGPSVAYLVSCKVSDSDDSETCDDAYTEDGSYKKFDFGVMIGAGIASQRVSLSLRYDMGLANIEQDEDWNSKHRALMLMVGFAL
jgi:hypothetical protein